MGDSSRKGPVAGGCRCIQVAGCSLDPDSGVRVWVVPRGWARGRGSTFLDELAPALGPVGELLRVGLLDLGALLHAVHQIIAQTVPIIDALHCPLVVPHLEAKQRAGLSPPCLPASPAPRLPASLPIATTSPGRRVLQRTPPPPSQCASGPSDFSRIWHPSSHPCLYTPSSHFKNNFVAVTKCRRFFIIWTWAK